MPTEHARQEPLEAILLVGGYGTRLRPLTLASPKHLLPTAGVPFLTHQFAKAAEAGITHVVLATSYRAEMFAERFGDGSELGLEITYVHEKEPLGTGGAIRNAAQGLRGGPDDPARRAALGELEQARAREFTWAASAEAHMASYQRAAAQKAE